MTTVRLKRDADTPPLPTRRSLRDDVRGAAALEFGMVAMPFLALVLAILQITITYFAQQTLETASDKAVRQLITGNAQRVGKTKAEFTADVCSKLPSFMKCENLMIDVRTVSSFADADTATPVITYNAAGQPTNSWEYSPGSGGQITIARVMYIWSVQAGPLGFDISTMTGSRRLLTAVNVFKTEPTS